MTAEEILAIIAPEFAEIDASGAISVAEMQIASSLGGTKRPMLVAYLAAHILTIGGRPGGATGDIESLTEGRVSVKYTNKNSKITSSGLSSTSYGRDFDRLSRAYIFSARTRNDIEELGVINGV